MVQQFAAVAGTASGDCDSGFRRDDTLVVAVERFGPAVTAAGARLPGLHTANLSAPAAEGFERRSSRSTHESPIDDCNHAGFAADGQRSSRDQAGV